MNLGLGMKKMDVREGLISLLEQWSDKQGITEATKFEDLPIDSLEFLEMLQAAEEKYGVHVPDTDLGFILTVNDLIVYFGNHLPS